MTANPCPNNTWNHTTGCTCTPNGSVTAEVGDIDLYVAHGTPMSSLPEPCPDFLPQRSGPPKPDFVRDPNKSIPGGAAEATANILRRALAADETDAGRAYTAYDTAIRQIDLLTPGVTQARVDFDNAVEEYEWRKESGTPERYVTESRRARIQAYSDLVKARADVGYSAPRASTIHREMGPYETAEQSKEMSHA